MQIHSFRWNCILLFLMSILPLELEFQELLNTLNKCNTQKSQRDKEWTINKRVHSVHSAPYKHTQVQRLTHRGNPLVIQEETRKTNTLAHGNVLRPSKLLHLSLFIVWFIDYYLRSMIIFVFYSQVHTEGHQMWSWSLPGPKYLLQHLHIHTGGGTLALRAKKSTQQSSSMNERGITIR